MMMISRRLSVIGLAGAVALTLSSCQSASEPTADFPSESITMVIPQDSGGPTDISGRALAKVLEDELGESVTVVNKGGAGGIPAMTEVMQSEPDGYTIAYTTDSPLMQSKLTETPYDFDDFRSGGGLIGGSPQVLVVNADAPWNSVKELSAANGEITYAIPGAGSVPHFNSVLIFDDLGVDGASVSFSGWSPSIQAVVAGDVDATVVDPLTAGPFVESGKVRALGVGPAQGVELPKSLADAPSLADAGVDMNKQLETLYGIALPADTPDAIAEKFQDAVEEARSSESIQKVARKLAKPVLEKDVASDWLAGASESGDLAAKTVETHDIKIG